MTGTPAQKCRFFPGAPERTSFESKENGKRTIRSNRDRAVAGVLHALRRKRRRIEIRDDIGFFQAVKAALAKKKRGESKSSDVFRPRRSPIGRKGIVPEGELSMSLARQDSATRHQHPRSIPSRSARGTQTQKRRRRAAGETLRRRIKVRSEAKSRSKPRIFRCKEDAKHPAQPRAIATQEVIEELIKNSRKK